MAPMDFFQRLKKLYKGAAAKDQPAITLQSAAALSILYTLVYVIPFYLSATTRPSPTLSRDAPSVIRARIRAVTFSCVFSTLTTLYIVITYGKAQPLEALRLLGWWPIGFLEIAKSTALTALLFVGPLFEKGIAEGEWRHWIRGSSAREVLGSWMGWRNLVAGPVTEEIVFRSALVPLHLLAKVAPKHIVFYTPLYFGIAHVHHFYEFTLTHPDTPLLPAIIRSVVQFCYTSIFGFYATFIFLRTGSLWAVTLQHSFCNWCGLPRLWGRVDAGLPEPPETQEGEQRRKGGPRTGVQARQSTPNQDIALGIVWTVAYYFLLVAGAVAFGKSLWPLTESRRALLTFEKK